MQVETPYVLMMSDDAVPLGRGFIGRLVAELERSDDSIFKLDMRTFPHPLPPGPAAPDLALRFFTEVSRFVTSFSSAAEASGT